MCRNPELYYHPLHFHLINNFEFLVNLFSSYGIAAIAPFSHRLTFDNLPTDIQRLRCKVNFQALAFVPHITALGEALINRLQSHSRFSIVGETNYIHGVTELADRQRRKFVVLHLRFDKV